MSNSEDRYTRQLRTETLAELGHHVAAELAHREERAKNVAADLERRLNSEVKSTNQREARLHAIRLLHVPREVNEDGRVFSRCKHCIIGYDPKTDQFVNAIWPCDTVKLADGKKLDE